MKAIEKLILGTVQFGLNYGINNPDGQVSSQEVASILSLAKTSGIRMLDTSYAYGNSESVIGNILHDESPYFDIVSKYPKSSQTVREVFEESLKRLGFDKLYGYLVHHFEFYQSKPEIWNEFRQLKDEGKVSKIGFSLYSVDQLMYLLEKKIDFDLLQFPCNIFDRQFTPWLKLLKEQGVEIHTRSVFLQGLFFKNVEELNDRLFPLKSSLKCLHDYCSYRGICVENLALSYVASNPYIDGVLIGVDNVSQLRKNISILENNIEDRDIDFVNSLRIKETELLNPVNWK